MSNKFVKNFSILFVFSVISKLLGLLREMILAHYYGASSITDAYVIAISAYSLLFSALSSTIVVSYVQHISKDNKNQNSVTTSLISIVAVIVATISAVICIFPEMFVSLFAAGFDAGTIDITVKMLYCILPVCFLLSIRYIFNGFLQVKGIFGMSGMNTVITCTFIIIAIILSDRLSNYYILPLGETVGIIITFIVTLVVVCKKGFKPTKFGIKDIKELRPILILMVPLFLGHLVQQLNVIVDKNFASLVGEGVISAINYANKVNIVFSAFFVTSITAVLFPALSKLSNQNREKFNQIAVRASKIISLLAFPVAVGIGMLAPEIIEVLFLRGQFTAENAKITSEILMIYAVGIPALGLNDILNKQFYAMGNTKTPVMLSVATLLVNILLNFIWVKTLGHIGLALSTTISVTALCALLNLTFKKKYDLNIIKENKSGLAKIIFASILMGAAVYGVKLLTTDMSALLITIACAAVGAVLYFAVLALLKEEELWGIYNRLIKRKKGECG